MIFKVVLYESEEDFTVFCLGLQGCITERDTKDDALENMESAIREYLEAVLTLAKQNIARDAVDEDIISASLGDVDVDMDGVEKAESEEVGAIP